MDNFTGSGLIPVHDESDFARYLRKVDGFLKLSVGILSVTGNTMVFIAFAISKRLQTKTNVFVINLALADFVTGLLMPIFAWSFFADVDFVEPWMDIMCGIAMDIVQASVGCSLITLALIAVNRLILITEKKETYQAIFRPRNIALLIAMSWAIPFIIDTTPLFFDVGELGFDEVAHICGAKTRHPRAYLYDVLLCIVHIPIPMLVIIYSYTRIFMFIRQHNKQFISSSGDGAASNLSTASDKYAVNHSPQARKERKNLKKQVDISKNLFYVIVVYVICLGPYLTAVLVGAGPYVLNQTKILAVSNSFMNPILYGARHPHFREVFRCILTCRWKDVPQPSRILKSMSRQFNRPDLKKSHPTTEKTRTVTPGESTTSV